MHALKGGWVGQIFALAKCNESGEKKSRVRRSKEERKSMVGSFIKKYQESNNGNFPSLNLTHKEVGGSFYTVREIVREIIQENRVLGTSKLSEGEQHTDQFLQQNPLGSISTAPETLWSVQLNGSSFIPSHHENANNESILVTDGISMVSEYKEFDSEHSINGNLVDVTNGNGTDKEAMIEVQVIASPESDQTEKQMDTSTSKITQSTADIAVETFPLRPVAEPTENIDGMSSKAGISNGNLDRTENEKVNVSLENGSVKLDDMNSSEVSVLTDKKEVENNENVLGNNSDLADKKVVENISDPLSESSDCTTGGTVMYDTPNGAALEVSRDDILTSEENEQSKAIVGEAINGSNGIHPKVHGTYKSTSEGDVVNSKKGSNQPLDRINLKSWERTSKSAAESKTNPLLAIFKSVITAFIKFWSE